MSKTTRTSKKQIHELEAMARETIDKSVRLYARYEYDATGKAYAVINGTRTAYASNTALYDAVSGLILQHDEEEFTPEPEPIIYATERTEATEPALFEAEVQEWETLLIQIEENELVDTRTGKSYIDGYRYTLCIVSKFGNLSTHYGLSSSGKTFRSCKQAADRMLKKYFNRRTGDIVATGATLKAMHASATDETVHERFKVWAAGLFPAEQDERAAVEAIAADMLEEYGNAEDATNATTYGVFADMHDGARPDDLEPADMEQMDRLMEYAAEAIASIQQTAEQAAFEARNIAIVNAGKATKELESLAVCLEDGDAEEAEICANWCATAAEAAEDAARRSAEHASKAGTETAQEAAETAQEAAETAQEAAEKARELSNSARDAARPTYQRVELLAYLGEPDDYDVTAIEAEATEHDPKTGARVWTAFGDDLAAIAERHQIATYAPAAVYIGDDFVPLDAAAALMDDDIRETIHAEGIDEPQQFADAYAAAHLAKFGEPFHVI